MSCVSDALVLATNLAHVPAAFEVRNNLRLARAGLARRTSFGEGRCRTRGHQRAGHPEVPHENGRAV